jgi:membrane protein
MRRLRRIFAFAVTVAQVAQEHGVTYPAAALAYYAFVSQIPVLVLVLALLGDSLARRTRTTLPAYLTPDAQQLVSEPLTAASGSEWAVVLAVGAFAWSGANVVLGFHTVGCNDLPVFRRAVRRNPEMTYNRPYQTVIERVEQSTRRPHLTELRDAGSILGSFGLVIVSVVLTNVVFALFPVGRVLAYSEPFVQFGLLTVAFIPLYYAPSQTVTSPTGALPGALTAAAGWTVLLTVIQIYAASAARYALFGVLSGIIIILTSLYLASVVLMIGVVVNTVYAETDDVAGASQP